jgi:adenylate kinase
MDRELSPRTRDELDLAFPPRAVSYRTQYREEDAAYVVEVRMEAARRIAERAINAIADTHEYISARAGHDLALEHQLRRIEETVSFCAAELVARYMGRH